MQINDGGPAYPVPYEFMGAGMSLRDQLAAQFAVAWVQAIVASHPNESREAIGIEANRLGLLQADHMLKQRTQDASHE
jgi:hypothetical protein